MSPDEKLLAVMGFIMLLVRPALSPLSPLSIYIDVFRSTQVVVDAWEVLILVVPFIVWSVWFLACSIFAGMVIWNESNFIRWSFISFTVSAYIYGASTFLFTMMRFVINYKSGELNLGLGVFIICAGLLLLSTFLWVLHLKLKPLLIKFWRLTGSSYFASKSKLS